MYRWVGGLVVGWSVGRWVSGRWSVDLIKPFFKECIFLDGTLICTYGYLFKLIFTLLTFGDKGVRVLAGHFVRLKILLYAQNFHWNQVFYLNWSISCNNMSFSRIVNDLQKAVIYFCKEGIYCLFYSLFYHVIICLKLNYFLFFILLQSWRKPTTVVWLKMLMEAILVLKLIGPVKKCLVPTDKCFRKDPEDIKIQGVKTRSLTKKERVVTNREYNHYFENK